jgi:predicted transposase YbfD/YdcC
LYREAVSFQADVVIVSIDAIGCRREIAGQIIGKGGHYLLFLKENQTEVV